MATLEAGPTRTRTRLAGVDAARGLAVLGMVAVHVLPDTDPDGSASLSDSLASGRSSAAFAVLAGVGVALATRAGDRWRQRLQLAVRALLIGALGLWLGDLDTGVAVILVYYAVFFLLLLPFLGWPVRRLLVTAAGVAVVVPLVSYAVRLDLEGLDPGNPTWSTLLQEPGRLAVDLLVTGVYPALPWATYLLTGLAVGKLALERVSTAVRLALAGAGLAVGATLASAALLGPLGGYDALATTFGVPRTVVEDAVGQGQFGNVPTESPWWLATDAPHSSTTPDLVATTGTALLALGVCLLLARYAGVLLVPLAAVGSMPLTVYTAHLLVLHHTDTDAPQRYYLLQVGAALLVAPLWRRRVGRGPLEELLAAAGRTVRGPT